MIAVIGHVEVHDTLKLAVVLLHIREVKTTIFAIVVGLYHLLSIVNQACRRTSFAIGDRKVNDVSSFPTFRIERSGTKEDTHHVVNTVAITVLFPRMRAVIMLPMLAHIAVSTRIRVQNLVHGVATSLPRSFAIIERSQVKRVVTQQRIAKHKHLINPSVATSGEAGPIRRLARIGA